MMRLIKKHLYDRSGDFKIRILREPLFWGVLLLKLGSSIFLASHYLTDLFAKFVNYFVSSGFKNPYDFFAHAGALDIFPYPNLMLWLLAVPRAIFSFLINTDYSVVSYLHLFLYRLPILLADIAILLVLSLWLKDKPRSVLKYYWCSPILFYISYVHGQLDAIPIALLFIALYFLFKDRLLSAFSTLGLAISAKTGMLIVLPFIISYLFLKRVGWKKILLFSFIPVAIFAILNAGYLFSEGFRQIVLETPQQFKIFDLKLNFGENFVIYLVPFAYLLLFINSLTYKTYNRDIFLMFLGFSFGILTFFIPPMQGWYYWIVPFFVYFYIKQNRAPVISWVALNVLYFLYFLVIPASDIFEVFAPTSPAIAQLPNLYAWLGSHGLDGTILVNSVFSLLQAALLLNVFWIYRQGIESTVRCKLSYQPYLIGLVGNSGSGKSTTASLLKDIFGDQNTALVEGDDMHKWERGNEMWKTFTHLDPRANDLHTNLFQAIRLKEGSAVHRKHYDHSIGRFTLPKKLESKKVIIFEGLHSLFLTKMRDVFNLKIFLKPSDELRVHWKIIRDLTERGHGKEKVLEQEQARLKDSEQYILTQEKYSDIVISLINDQKLTEGLGDTNAHVPTHLSIRYPNYINTDSLLSKLAEEPSISPIDQSFSDESQTITISGNISAERIDQLAYTLFPELWDVITLEPKWVSDYPGLIQLFICYYIFEQLKLEEYEKGNLRAY
ncbi:hypothetical protein JXA59_01255 [Patescibacteria group bacterium]|nr:hypothetical protein [Patescibacteria group bacterium]